MTHSQASSPQRKDETPIIFGASKNKENRRFRRKETLSHITPSQTLAASKLNTIPVSHDESMRLRVESRVENQLQAVLKSGEVLRRIAERLAEERAKLEERLQEQIEKEKQQLREKIKRDRELLRKSQDDLGKILVENKKKVEEAQRRATTQREHHL
uniref:Uncharacterized protein n=1 Tax=Polytomella parva TaxID=51329 RepID=A0A7S0UVE1_9CHLO|mmetsp:Transcript_18155/g.33179  ORF Transcript_18155/g.33179 Transcript_18155/m.33179 type:complete len:157 (+) Transcript_18155:96-566(+)